MMFTNLHNDRGCQMVLLVPGLAHWNDVVRRVDEAKLEYCYLKVIAIRNKVAKPSIMVRSANQVELSDVRGDSLNNTWSACGESRFLPELVLCFTRLPTS